jgi:hypothetical protein
MKLRALSCGFLLLLVACEKPGAKKSVGQRIDDEKQVHWPSLGQKRLEGETEELRASINGQLVTVLRNGRKPAVQGIPPMLHVGELWAVPMPSGEAVKLGGEVSNMAGGWLHTLDSQYVIFLDAWDQRVGAGDLHVESATALSGKTPRLAAQVSYFVPSDDGKQMAFVVGGVLSTGLLPAGPFRQIAGEVSTAEFSPDGAYLYFKRKHSAAGGLYQVLLSDTHAQPKRLLDNVSEFSVLQSGTHVVASARENLSDVELQLHVFDVKTLKGRKIADDSTQYRASRDGQRLAYRTLYSKKGDTPDVGQLYVVPIGAGTPVKLGDNVKDFEFSADGKRLAFRANYLELPLIGREAKESDVNKRLEKVGDLSLVEFPNLEPKVLYKLCPNYLFASTGHALAFTARIERPEITRRLFILNEGAEKPVPIKDWLYEYMFSPDSHRLYFRADCIREGRACGYLSVPLEYKEKEKPTLELDGVFGGRFSSDGARSSFGFARLTDASFDLVSKNWTTSVQTQIDQKVQWPVLNLGRDGKFVAYLVKDKQRPGLYVAQVP